MWKSEKNEKTRSLHRESGRRKKSGRNGLSTVQRGVSNQNDEMN